MKKKFTNLLMITLLPLMAFAQQTQQVLSVEEAVAIGLENNYSILIARNNQSVAENNVSLGNAGFLPQLNADGLFRQTIEDTDLEFLDGQQVVRDAAQSENFAFAARLDWIVFDGLRMFTSYSQLKQFREQGELEARLQVENSVAEIINTYFEIVAYQRQVRAIESALEFSRERLVLAQEKLNIGSGSRLQMLQARVDFNSDTTALMRQLEQIATAKVELNRLMGRSLTEEFAVADEIPHNQNLVLNEVLQSAQNQNTSLQLARTEQQIAQKDIQLLQSARLPTLSLNAGYNYNTARTEAGFLIRNQTDGYFYGATARINLFNGFNLNRQIQNSRIQLQSAELVTEQERQQVEANIITTWQAYQNNLELLRIEEDNLDVAQQNRDIAMESYRLGNISSIELRTAQENYLTSESRYTEALYRVKTTETQLLRLSGQLLR